MNTFAAIFALIASLSSPNAPAQKDIGIIKATIHTVRPARQPKLAPHHVSSPSVRFVGEADGCTVRTLANDASGQTVKVCR